VKIGKLVRNDYPVGLIVDIHDYCNARCKMCPYEFLHKKLDQGKMDWSLYAKIVNDFSTLIERYKFKGMMTYCNMGEPFMMKSLFKYTSYAEQKGIDVYINTNASLMTPSKLDLLFNSGFHGSFNISFHAASKELYKDIMGLDYEKTLKNIEYLIANYSKKKISINALNYHWPSDEGEKIHSLFKKLGIDISVNKPISRAGLMALYRKSSRYIIAGCGPERVLYQMIITHNGDVLLCCNDMARKAIVGNVKQNSIQQVWNGAIFNDFLEKIYMGKPSAPNFICKLCEESVPYFSVRRFIKSLFPKKTLEFIKSRKDEEWIISKALQNDNIKHSSTSRINKNS